MHVVKKSLSTLTEYGQEKHVLEKTTSHPYLVGLYSFFLKGSRLFFALDYVNRGELFYMKQQRILPEEHAILNSAEISLAFSKEFFIEI